MTGFGFASLYLSLLKHIRIKPLNRKERTQMLKIIRNKQGIVSYVYNDNVNEAQNADVDSVVDKSDEKDVSCTQKQSNALPLPKLPPIQQKIDIEDWAKDYSVEIEDITTDMLRLAESMRIEGYNLEVARQSMKNEILYFLYSSWDGRSKPFN